MSGSFLELAQAMQLALKSLQMYTASHPRSVESMAKVNQILGAWLGIQPKLHIAASAGKLFIDGTAFEGQSVHVNALNKQMGDRQILGFLIKRGATPEDILSLLQLLILKPAKIEELGGPEKVLKDLGTRNIEITQTRYQVIRDGDSGEDDGRGPAENPKPRKEEPEEPEPVDETLDITVDPTAGSSLSDAAGLMAQWQAALQQALSRGQMDGGGTFKINLSGLGGLAEKLGIGESFPHPIMVETLRRSLLSMSGEAQLGVVAGMETLPASPAGLRMAFQAVAAELFASATANMLANGASWSSLQGPMLDILAGNAQRQAMVHAFAAMLKTRGADPARIQAMLQELDWDNMPLETKLQKMLDEKGYFGMSPDRTLKFLRELLDRGRDEQFLRVLDDILEGITIEDPSKRETVARLLAGVAHWIMDPGLPEGAEGRLIDGFKGDFGWEPVVHIHSQITEGLGAILASMVYRGELVQAQGLLQELMDLVSFMEEESRDWREKALARLHARLCQEELVDRAIRELVSGSQERMLTEFVPYLEFLGDAGAEGLVRQLGDEPDRHRRARLMEGIRATGSASVHALVEAMRSNTWYLARNALNLLGEMGDAGMLEEVLTCFTHSDGRVRRAAVRAAWKLAGPGAEQALLKLLPNTDPETQMEVLFALGQVRSVNCIPSLAVFVQDRRIADRLRHKAIEVLGQIGNPAGVAPLAELLKRKGFAIFSSAAEPSEIRLSAFKALASMGLPGAIAQLRKTVEAEPKGPDRTAMELILATAVKP
jgi:HEAT repeat protein